MNDNISINSKKRAILSVLLNFFYVIILIFILLLFSEKSKYMTFGPNETLNIMGFTIDTWYKWSILSIILIITSIFDVLANEFGMPYVSFRIYNPDCKIIDDIKPLELQLLANTIYALSSIKYIFYVVISVTQIDLALIKILTGELLAIYTVRIMINEKTFIDINNDYKIIH